MSSPPLPARCSSRGLFSSTVIMFQYSVENYCKAVAATMATKIVRMMMALIVLMGIACAVVLFCLVSLNGSDLLLLY